jgi:long-chain fatty acid transport protein
MKNLLTILCITVLVLSISPPLMAGGITNKQNFSTEYLRTSSRNAATDSADAAVFNPAGVTKMEDGFYLNAGAFYAFKDYSNTIGGIEYKSDEPSIVPSMIGVYKKGNWAAFGAVTIPAGGGKVVYNTGDATTLGYGTLLMTGVNYTLTQPPYSLPSATYYSTVSSQRIEAESIYYGYTLGFVYAFNDFISIALGERYIDANKEASASITIDPSALGTLYSMPSRPFDIDYKQKADGIGGFIGINITPQEDKLNIGVRYETKTHLNFETSVSRDDTGMLTNGAKEREDLPGLIGIGVGFRFNPEWKIDTSYTYYLEKNAVRQNARFKYVGNGYDIATAVEYAFAPKLKATLGFMLTDINMNPDDMLPEGAELDAKTICGGIFYEVTPNLDLNFALMKNIYSSEVTSMSKGGVELGKKVFSFGFGLQYKFK